MAERAEQCGFCIAGTILRVDSYGNPCKYREPCPYCDGTGRVAPSPSEGEK